MGNGQSEVAVTPGAPHLVVPSWPEVWRSFQVAVLPQLSLTLTNAVIVTASLSRQLFPSTGSIATERRLALSSGLANVLLCPFGAMPMCHGAGGLAGQYRFGARTSGSILFLGVSKMALAVAFGARTMALCQAFPAAILGVLLAFSGTELALVARDQTHRNDAFVALATAGVSLAVNNVAIGFVVGLLVAAVLRVTARGAGDGA